MNIIETVAIRLVASAVLGIILGLEREIKRKPLGLKTCLVISVTSCLITFVSFEAAAQYSHYYHLPDADPTRISAQIVSGIGFLGGGVILKKNNDMVTNLTTASIIWAAGGLGIASGAGFYLEAFMALVVLLIGVEFVPKLIRKFGPKSLNEKDIKIYIHKNKKTDNHIIIQSIKEQEVDVENVIIEGAEEEEKLFITGSVSKENKATDLYGSLIQEGILKIRVEILH